VKRSCLAILSLLVCCSCGDAEEASVEASAEPAEPAASSGPTEEPEPSDPEHPEPPVDEEAQPPASPTALPEGAPEAGCELSEPVRIFGGDAWADIAATESGFIVAGVSRLGDGEHAFAVSIGADRAPRQIARRALDDDAPAGHRRSAPVVAVAGERAAFAYVDGTRHLRVAFLDVAEAGTLRFMPAGEDASLQFPPSMAWRDEQLLLAWTELSTGHRRVLVSRIQRGRAGTPVDVTPASGGASAPAFVAGAAAPRLLFVDAREAISVVHRVDAAGEALGAVEVVRPISMLTDPPAIAPVALEGSDWVVYTGIGATATTAVGMLAAGGSMPPVTVVPGTGYGVLTIDVSPFGLGALIAAEAPTEAGPGSAEAPREVHLRTTDASGQLGEPVIVRGPRGSASRVRLAVRGGTVGLVFTDRDGAYAAMGRCAAP